MEISSAKAVGESGSEDYTETESSENGSYPSSPIAISAPLPPNRIVRSRKIWSKILHAAALPSIVGVIVFWIEGDLAGDLLRRAWPLMALLGLAYVGAWGLNSKFERYPFIHQFEAALLSVGLTLVPAGLFFAVRPGSPINTLALYATIGGMAWYLGDKSLHRRRKSNLILLPGGSANRLLAGPHVSLLDMDRWFQGGGLDGIVMDLHTSLSTFADKLADYSMRGVPTYHSGYLYERLTARVLLDASSKTNVDVEVPAYYPYLKRGMDVLLIVASLPVTVPVALLTAAAIRLESAGPILFWQERLGWDGETFQMAKFRSMYHGNPGEDGDVFADVDDDRVTTVGQFIRTFRIDELPQFWNVLKGEMSLIGPRPEQVGLAEDFAETISLYEYRHLARPGITGWAQVLEGYAADEKGTRRKLERDLYYVKHRSLTLDLLIIYLTFKTILSGFGAR